MEPPTAVRAGEQVVERNLGGLQQLGGLNNEEIDLMRHAERAGTAVRSLAVDWWNPLD